MATLEARIARIDTGPLCAALERENLILRRALDKEGAVFLERSDISKIQESFDVTPRQAELMAVLYRAPRGDWIGTETIRNLMEYKSSTITLKTQIWHIRKRIGEGWINSHVPSGYQLSAQCRERIDRLLRA